jgi:alpha-ketoglutarate-dependent taurine dioxygenase
MSDNLIREPLQLSGVLDEYDSFDVTPIIGREFPTANLKEWLGAANSDALLRDLAITVSQRGVVFFRKQGDMDDDLQKELAQRLGELSGKPTTSGLHIHPIMNSNRKMGGDDDRISILSREMERTQWDQMIEPGLRQSAIIEWHSDITFEACPSDYAVLRLTELPNCGGGQYIHPVSPIPMDSP